MAAPFLVIFGWARQAIEPMKWKFFPFYRAYHGEFPVPSVCNGCQFRWNSSADGGAC